MPDSADRKKFYDEAKGYALTLMRDDFPREYQREKEKARRAGKKNPSRAGATAVGKNHPEEWESAMAEGKRFAALKLGAVPAPVGKHNGSRGWQSNPENTGPPNKGRFLGNDGHYY